MSGSDLFVIAFAAVGVMIAVTVWAAMVLESAEPGDAPGEPRAPERKAA